MIFPFGLPYTLWRMVRKKPVCKYCSNELLVPVDSIAGQRLVAIAAGETYVPPPPTGKDIAQEPPAAPMQSDDTPPQEPQVW